MRNPIYTVLSRIMESDTLKGFLLVDDIGEVRPVNMKQVEAAGNNAVYTNAIYDSQFKTLTGTQGSLTSYPTVNMNYALTSKGGVVVLAVILEQGTDEPIGVVAYDAIGTRYNVSFKKLDEILRKNNPCNFQLINRGTFVTAVQKNGNDFPTVEMKTRDTTQRLYHSGKGESKPVKTTSKGIHSLPELTVYSFDFVKTSEFGQSATSKLAEAGINMKTLTPYYYTIYQTVSKKPVLGLGTMGVTEDTLYYDIQFVASLSVAQLTFVLIHEVLHMAMQHSIRFGNRANHELWNIATDLYINSVICHEFGVTFGAGEKSIEVITQNRNGVNVSHKGLIQTPSHGVFLETIGETLDLARETPETIYDKLLKENPQMGTQNKLKGRSGKASNTSQSGQNSSSQGNGQKGQSNGNENEQNGQNSKNGQQSGNSQSSQGGQQSDSQTGNQDGQSSGDFSNSEDMSKQGSDDLHDNSGEKEIENNVQKVSVVYNGKKLTGTIMMDVMYNNSSKTDDAKQENIDASKSALQRMATKLKMVEEETGESPVKNAGVGGALTQRYIEFGLSTGIRWQDLVRNLCKKKPKKTFTLAQPNTDYMNMGMTIASRRPIGKPTMLSGIKFAVDISGSVSQAEVNLCLSELGNIYRLYKVDGELIYWSTHVGDAGMCDNIKDLVKVRPISDGGTSVRCVFDYLSGKTKVNDRKEPDKMRDIEAIFILTDGCFSNDYGQYAEYFGRKTYWLITGNPITFNPPFGRVIGVELK